ncbi:hypothetical protein MMPV_005921 [Pyropia vietnamensis]
MDARGTPPAAARGLLEPTYVAGSRHVAAAASTSSAPGVTAATGTATAATTTFATVTAMAAAAAAVTDVRAVAMERSPMDDRQYRLVGLPNSLRVLLVSDYAADHAAACLNVAIGSLSDPPGLPGLAHFCEHMCFLGTAKFPSESSFSAHLEAHGGKHNAFTGRENTSYYFSVVVDKTGGKGREVCGAPPAGGASAIDSSATDTSSRDSPAGDALVEGTPAEVAAAAGAPTADPVADGVLAGDGLAGDAPASANATPGTASSPPRMASPLVASADAVAPTASLAATGQVDTRAAADAEAVCASSPPMPPGLGPYHEALDRFSQFFIAPLFTASATAREVQAVESEFRNRILKDADRLDQVCQSVAAPGHPEHGFHIGNAASLWDEPVAAGVDVRAALLKFHKDHYSANRMTLVLVAPAPLDTLAAWAGGLFGPIPNTYAPAATDAYAGRLPYGPAETGRLLRVVPIKERRLLILRWMLPPRRHHYRTAPVDFIARRFKFSGPGSLLSALRARGWASSLTAASYESVWHWQTLQVLVDLTLKGAAPAATDEVIQSVFAYLRLLAAKGVTRRAYQDAADITHLAWTYQEREEPGSLAQTLADRMHVLPDEHLLCEDPCYAEYDESLILGTLRLLTPAAALVMVMDPSFRGSTDRVEKWYGTAYSNTRIPDDTLAVWATASPWPELVVGPPNKFIPTDLALVCDVLDGAASNKGGAMAPRLPHPGQSGRDESHAGATPIQVLVAAAAPSTAGQTPLPSQDKETETESGKEAGRVCPAVPSFHANGGATVAAWPVWDASRLGPVVSPADATASAHPVLLRDSPSVRLHYQLDRVFRRPKAYVSIWLISPAVHESTRSWVLATLAARMLYEDLCEDTADAAEADLHYVIDPVSSGLYVFFFGYTHMLPLLLKTVMGRLSRLKADPTQFVRIAEEIRRGFRNQLRAQPLQHAQRMKSILTCTPRWHLADFLCVFGEGPAGALSQPSLDRGDDGGGAPSLFPPVSPPTPAEVDAFMTSLWAKGLFVEALVTGNVSPEGALALMDAVRAALPAPALPLLEHPCQRTIQLPARQTVVAPIASPNPQDANSAVHVLYQFGTAGDPVRDVALALLVSMLADHVFTVLRTEQQLGYIASSQSEWSNGVNGLSVYVQSPSASPETVAARIQACLDNFGTSTLPTMDIAPFKVALTAALREPDKQLWSSTSRYLTEIVNHTYHWMRRDAEATALEGVDTSTLCRLWATHVATDAPQRRVLVSAVHPPQHPLPLSTELRSSVAERVAGGRLDGGHGGDGGDGGGDSSKNGGVSGDDGDRGGSDGGSVDGRRGGDSLPPIVLPDVAANPGVARAFRNSRPLYPVYGYFTACGAADL